MKNHTLFVSSEGIVQFVSISHVSCTYLYINALKIKFLYEISYNRLIIKQFYMLSLIFICPSKLVAYMVLIMCVVSILETFKAVVQNFLISKRWI